ncbi:polysulfide reductase NrfD [Streptomyces sp. J2-1]|uniref:NrfD/PsrC family molybdoenzyme membrane anchor subunit n=1 Tax=Streptomyces corallincola TaxID=2851888 RepID=UPI001C3925E1|nr:NrfD/PsrC family molybdoenzyme membrane anchor subunit [Streptomyces corallincola]MBV2355671.1 polysulfide reductase NrfD [Streptomyces corallincola]
MSGDGTTDEGRTAPGDGAGGGPAGNPSHNGGKHRRRKYGRNRGDDGSREESMVPRAEFQSYYGRPVLKPPVWEWKIPAYLFTGGLSAASTMLSVGADLTGRPGLARTGRVGGAAALAASMYLLVADLGRPFRFHHMMRVAKPSSPMSVGTWILIAYSPGSMLAATAELLPASLRGTLPGRLLRFAARPAGMSAAVFAPGVASYTAVLLAQTAVPAWNDAHRELPFVFTGSAAASAAGLGMVCAPLEEAGPARRLAAIGAAVEIVASRMIDRRPGFVTTAYTTGHPHHLRKASEYLTLGGALTALTLARRSRVAAAVGGLALMAGSVFQRFGVFEAGVHSTKDPAYVVKPQRERLDARKREEAERAAEASQE